MFIIARDGYDWCLIEGALYRAPEDPHLAPSATEDQWELVFDSNEGKPMPAEYSGVYEVLDRAE